jgi:2-polyprenyl-6-hydroxyphenyl methylase/3-demethylubiquinone-9 3-methyltransferase
LLTAKLAAEYVLRWLPAGTHDWRKFVTPVEMGHGLRDAGLRVADITGMAPDLLTGRWRTTRDLAVNYMEMAAS